MTNYRRKRTLPKDRTPQYNVNRDISAQTLRVLDEEGNMLGIFTRKEAMALAEEKEVDIIEINPKAEPPVVRFMDYNKFKYQFQKSQAARSVKADDTKQIRVSVRISINDLKVQVRKIDQFLEKGLKVRLQVRMMGRERQHPEVAEETMTTLISLISKEYDVETPPKLAGDSFLATIKPRK